MQNRIGTTDVSVTPITLGAWAIGGAMWGGNEEADSIAAIKASIDNGITSIDTAPVYGMGYSEELVGKAIRGYDRSKLQILTKFGMVWDQEKGDYAFERKDNAGVSRKIYKYGGYENAIKEVEISLKRLQTDYIDLIQLHWPDSTTPVSETMEAMQKMLDEGKVRAIGVCNYNGAQLAEAEQTVKLASDQVPYSMLKRNIEKDVVPYALANELSVIAYSPMERGLLTGKYNAASQFAADDHRSNYFKQFDMDKVAELTARLAEMAAGYQVAVAQLVLAWTAHQPAVAAALAGARNAKQAAENAGAMHLELAEADLAQIEEWLAGSFLS
ncbi:aldo/keto reductase [Niabella drilacis]|uniref:Predicted oxidoreductase n=1 Tax=Niabella drilacis (strain DSM 25811 / CCM 8410 / CCUG 62505 / LMG 26954 / E90) TaxID=1285928 RepID=A0A1G7AMM8_NIADE|nr:aldo/keto reductase [Niabella drilacis]SDE16138.1 Predicted oxidoreductase [Niabella drilacis]